MSIAPTRDELARMFPRALSPWMGAITRLAPELCQHYSFTRLDWAGLAGQIGHECNGLTLSEMRENMRFTTTKRILEVYSYRLGVALKRDAGLQSTYGTKTRLAAALRNQPEFLADVVYGGREGTPWMRGSLYIGRGPTQITHLDNYRAVMEEIRKQPGGDACPDLVATPDVLSSDAEMGVRSAFADWHLKGLSRWARDSKWDAVSAALNTGSAYKVSITKGLDSRRRWTAKALGIWPETTSSEQSDVPVAGVSVLREGSRGADVSAAQELLRQRGYAVGAVDGIYGLLTARAVAAFQREHGLPVDGDLDAPDMEVLQATAPADLGERAVATHVPGSQQEQAGRNIEMTGKMGLGMGLAEMTGQAAGFSPFDAARGYLTQAVESVGHVTSLGLKMDPRIGGVVVACIGGAVLWRWGRSVRIGRVISHRLGLNLSR